MGGENFFERKDEHWCMETCVAMPDYSELVRKIKRIIYPRFRFSETNFQIKNHKVNKQTVIDLMVNIAVDL